MTDTPQPATDPLEDAVATVLLHGGAVVLNTDRMDTPESRCDLRVSYRGRDSQGIELAGSVTVWAQRHGAALQELGWAPTDILRMERLQRTWVRLAEERWREQGIDYRRDYVRVWWLPPLTPEDLLRDLRATLAAADGRPPEQVNYVVNRDGPLERRVVRGGIGLGLLSLVLGVYVAGFPVATRSEVAPEQTWQAILAGVLVFLAVFFPVRWRIGRMRGAGKWGWLPFWTGMFALPGMAIIVWTALGS